MTYSKDSIPTLILAKPPVFKLHHEPLYILDTESTIQQELYPINLDINAIVSIDEDWGIGKDNDLLVYNKDDLKYFKQLTERHTVIMGRKTLESLPAKKALPNRTNIVLSRDPNYKAEGATVVNSIEELKFALIVFYSYLKNNKVFVIGENQYIKNYFHTVIPFILQKSIINIMETNSFQI